jgi:hypothetical protein
LGCCATGKERKGKERKGKERKGKERKDCIESDLQWMGVKRWRKKAEDRSDVLSF